MASVVHLLIEEGPDRGREFTVPEEGLRVGRAPKNDVVLRDPLLSRHHCRFFFRPNDGLWVIDLGSANQTIVNDNPVVDAPIRVGDRVTIGDTVIRVLNDGRAPVTMPPKMGEVDLGLPSSRKPAATPRSRRGPLILLGFLLVALGAAAALLFLSKSTERQAPAPLDQPVAATLEVDYESVQAGTNSIFRYRLQISRDGTLSIDIDDTDVTHVHKEGQVKPDLLRELAAFISDAGFFDLAGEYEGIRKDSLEQRDISVTSGARTHRVRVLNRVEPAAFEKVREKLEYFGHVQLGLYAIKSSPEKLIELAGDALLLGKKYYAEREIAYGNLANAVKSFAEAEFYLDTVEPKPDFYAEILSGKKDSEEDLQKRYDDQNFVAEKFIRTKDWENAAQALRVICDMVPNAEDPRHEDARKKLLEVESRLKKRR